MDMTYMRRESHVEALEDQTSDQVSTPAKPRSCSFQRKMVSNKTLYVCVIN